MQNEAAPDVIEDATKHCISVGFAHGILTEVNGRDLIVDAPISVQVAAPAIEIKVEAANVIEL
jgi:hypothetical protein